MRTEEGVAHGVAWPVFAQRLWGSNLKRTKNEKMDFEEGKKGKREAD